MATYRIKKLNDPMMRDFTIAIANHLVRFQWNHQDRTLIGITNDEEAAAAAKMRPEKYFVEEMPEKKPVGKPEGKPEDPSPSTDGSLTDGEGEPTEGDDDEEIEGEDETQPKRGRGRRKKAAEV